MQLRFGDHLLDVGRRELRRGGELIRLEPQVFDLLVYLVSNRDRVVTKDDLLDSVWSGRVVSESTLTSRINAARRAIGDSGEAQRLIRTAPRKGFRFVGEVTEPPVEESVRLLTPPDRPSIAVLPFQNLSGDSEQEYFADGLTEDIITGLSRLRWFFVIARNSSFAYKGKTPDIRQVARELGVRYVLEGSVRKAGDHLRVTAQLIDATTGAHIWAERYDRPIAEIFAVQDEITRNVVAAIEPQLYEAEGLRFKTQATDSLDAWGCVVRSMPYIWTTFARDDDAGIELLNRAIKLDPRYARAHSLLAWATASRTLHGQTGYEHAIAVSLPQAQHAIELDPGDPWAHLAAGFIYSISRRFAPAVEEIGEALERNPNFARAELTLGMAQVYVGNPDEGLRHVEIANRLSPRDISQAVNLATTGLGHLIAGRYPEAVTFGRRAVQLRRNFTSAWRSLAAAAGLAGDLEQAASALAQAKRLQPSLTIDWVEKYHPIMRAEDRSRYIDGLRKAGLT